MFSTANFISCAVQCTVLYCTYVNAYTKREVRISRGLTKDPV
jgi:hypothetical protein